MATIRRPRRIFVTTFTGELFEAPIAQADGHDLERLPHHGMKCHGATIGRPVRRRTMRSRIELRGRQQLDVRSVCIHGVDLGMSGSSRHEGDTAAVGAEGGRNVVASATDREPMSPAPAGWRDKYIHAV